LAEIVAAGKDEPPIAARPMEYDPQLEKQRLEFEIRKYGGATISATDHIGHNHIGQNHIGHKDIGHKIYGEFKYRPVYIHFTCNELLSRRS